MSFTLALRNILRHRLRSLITLVAISLGGVVIIFIQGFFSDTYKRMRESYIHAHSGHFQIFKKGYENQQSHEPYAYLIENPEEILGKIQGIDEVKFATPRIQFSGMASTGENSVSFLGQGVDTRHTKHILLGPSGRSDGDPMLVASGVIEKGETLTPSDEYGVQLGQGLAASIGAEIGDSLILMSGSVAGSLNTLDVMVKGIFSTSSKPFDDRFLQVNLESAQSLLRTDSVQSIFVILKDTSYTEKVSNELQAIIDKEKLPLEFKSWEEMNDFYFQTKQLFEQIFFVLKVVVALILLLSIYSTVSLSVIERTVEIGTLQALGFTRKNILSLFLTEGFVLGLVGGCLGIIFGVSVTYAIQSVGLYMPPPPGATHEWFSRPELVGSAMVFSIFFSIFISLLSFLKPAMKASKLEIAEALRFSN